MRLCLFSCMVRRTWEEKGIRWLECLVLASLPCASAIAEFGCDGEHGLNVAVHLGEFVGIAEVIERHLVESHGLSPFVVTYNKLPESLVVGGSERLTHNDYRLLNSPRPFGGPCMASCRGCFAWLVGVSSVSWFVLHWVVGVDLSDGF